MPVTQVADLTGFPECLEGRVKTLHPRVHAGILADLRKPDHARQLAELGIDPFELVVVNLYPFAATVASGATPEECVEQIDIGGPTMVRAAAKNHPSVAVVTSPDRYGEVLDAVAAGGFTHRQRVRLAAEAFTHTATYDIAVASWMGSVLSPVTDSRFPTWVGASWHRTALLRYGENPHQEAALYAAEHAAPGLAQADQLHGKEMSYNNYVDADAARRAAYDFAEPAVAIIKHANPCGIAVGVDIADAYRKAFDCDPVSAYGGVVATNRPVTVAMADAIGDVFTEVVVAPAFDEDALEVLAQRKSVRLLRCDGRHPGRSARVARRQRRAAHAGDRRRGRGRRRAGELDARLRRTRGRRDAVRPRVRVAGLPVGQVQRDRARGRRRDRGRRDGAGQPGRLGPAGGGPGR